MSVQPPPKPMPKPAPVAKPGAAPAAKPAPAAPAPKGAPLGKPGAVPHPKPAPLPGAQPGAHPAPRPLTPAPAAARSEPVPAPSARPPAPASTPKAAPAVSRPQPPVAAASTAKDMKNLKEVHLLIGPPAAPVDMREMYADADRRKAAGDDSLVQQLSSLRKATVSYFIKEPGPARPMLQRVLEEKLGREVTTVVATVELVMVSGALAHSLNINLVKTTFADGSPISPAFSKDVLRAVKNSVGCIFAATWVHERLF